jgi:hypothetical protein
MTGEVTSEGKQTAKAYFNAFKRAFSRDLYRAAVFLCRTPF